MKRGFEMPEFMTVYFTDKDIITGSPTGGGNGSSGGGSGNGGYDDSNFGEWD